MTARGCPSKRARRWHRAVALLAGLGLLVAGGPFEAAKAAAQHRLRAAAPPDAGARLVRERCAACHGLDGNTPDPAFPKLAGQIEPFLVLQLRNYRSGERPHPAMAAVAATLSDADIDAVAHHFAAQVPMRHGARADPDRFRRGETVYRDGKVGAPACRHCHGETGQGLAPVFPRLAGQHPSFIVASLQPYRRESQFANPYAFVMKAVIQEWSDDDLQAVADYLGSLR